jgi:hypothetical protein
MTHTAEPMTLTQLSERLRKYPIPGYVETCNFWADSIDVELAKQREAKPGAWIAEPDDTHGSAGLSFGPMRPTSSDRWKPLYKHPQQRNAVEVTDSQFQIDLESAAGSLVEACGVEESGNILKDIYSALKRMEKLSAKNVTDEMVDLALDIWFNRDGDWREYPQGEADCYRHDMRAALESAVASRDRDDVELFGIHMIGPDDIIAAPSKEAAERVVSNFNQYWDNHKSERGHDVHVVAKLTTWEFGAIEHAKDVVKNFGEYVDLLEPFDAARRENKP